MKHCLFTLFITSALLLSSCRGKTDPAEPVSLMEASKQELATAVAERDRLLSLVTEITASMERVKQLEHVLSVAGTNPKETSTQRSKLIADINAIKATLRQRREQLAETEARLKDSSLYNDRLQSTVEALRKQIDSLTREIDALQSQLSLAHRTIDSLNVTVDSLSTSVVTATSERDSARRESTLLANQLNTCYYVAAPKATLKRHKIIDTGFLRKTRLMGDEFDRGVFTTSDKRDLHILQLPSPKARILTNHPAGSYTLSTGRQQPSSLTITDPDRFWSLTNYLVIQTD